MLDTQAYSSNLKALRFKEDDVAFTLYALWRKNRRSTDLDAFVRALSRVTDR